MYLICYIRSIQKCFVEEVRHNKRFIQYLNENTISVVSHGTFFLNGSATFCSLGEWTLELKVKRFSFHINIIQKSKVHKMVTGYKTCKIHAKISRAPYLKYNASVLDWGMNVQDSKVQTMFWHSLCNHSYTSP